MQGSLSQRFGFLLAAAGLGLCGYAGLQWYQLPHYSEDDLKASAELNLQLDLAREGTNAAQLDPARLEQRRQLVQQEVRQEVEEHRRQPLNFAIAAVALLLVALLRIALTRQVSSLHSK